MAQISDVLTCLMSYADTEGYTAEQLEPCCERGLEWVEKRLKPGADKEDSLIIHTAAALAHYYFFYTHLTETDKYESYKAGDMTVKRSIEKAIKAEAWMRDEAIAAAAAILIDGGFYCSGY